MPLTNLTNSFTKQITSRICKAAPERAGEYDIMGVVSKYGKVDLVGDVMEKGCMTKFVNAYNETGVANMYGTPLGMYFQHAMGEPLGYWKGFEEKEDEVIGYGKFYETQMAKDIRTIAKDENSIIGGFSIGFSSKNYEDIEDEDGKFKGYRFKEITLKEVSLVTTPAMPEAKIMQVKSAHHANGTLNLAVVERSLREAGASKSEARKVVHAVKDYILIHIEVDAKGDEVGGDYDDGEEAGGMLAMPEMDEIESKKVLAYLAEINTSAKEKAFLKEINESFKS